MPGPGLKLVAYLAIISLRVITKLIVLATRAKWIAAV